MRTLLVLGLAGLLGLTACGGDGSSDDPGDGSSIPLAPANWTERSTSCGFSFRAPGDLVEESVENIDSCVVQYDNGNCSLLADYGGFSDPLDWTASESDYDASQVTVDGRQATVVSVTVGDGTPGPYATGVHFPEVDAENPGLKLTIWIGCVDAASRDELKPLAGTIRFD